MKKYKPEELKGKFVVGFDTICQGHRCALDENEKPDPHLYDSYDEAFEAGWIFLVPKMKCEKEVKEYEEKEDKEELRIRCSA